MDDVRTKVFLEELGKLRRAELITQGEWEKVNWAHDHFYESIRRYREYLRGQADEPRLDPLNPADDSKWEGEGFRTTYAPQTSHASHAPHGSQKPGSPQWPNAPHASRGPQPVLHPQPVPHPQSMLHPQPPPRPPLDPQQIRDRNITWILILGVVFTLLAGITLATSTWDLMGSAAKTGVIALVSVLFFGIGIFAENTLKIRKTGLAFWSLGCLFLPVTVLSAGYYELLGSWFSLSGGGRFLLGFLGCLLCVPVYAYSCRRYENPFFAWFTLVGASVGLGFLAAAFHPPADLFFLLIGLCSTLVVALRCWKVVPGFLQPFAPGHLDAFAQIHLAGSTAIFFTFAFSNLPTPLGAATFLLFAGNFTWLSTMVEKPPATWGVPVMLVLAVQYVFSLLAPEASTLAFAAVSGATAAALFVGLYWLNRWSPLRSVRPASSTVSILLMAFAAAQALVDGGGVLDAALFLALGAMLYLTEKRDFSVALKRVNHALLPLTVLLAMAVAHASLPETVRQDYTLGLHLGVVTVLLTVLSRLFQSLDKRLEAPFFWTGQLMIPLAFLLMMDRFGQAPFMLATTAGLLLYGAFWTAAQVKARFVQAAFLSLSIFAAVWACLNLASMRGAPVWGGYFVLPVVGLVLAGVWTRLSGLWKTIVHVWAEGLLLTGAVVLCVFSTYGASAILVGLASIALLLAMHHVGRRTQLNVLPLLLLIPVVACLDDRVLRHDARLLFPMILLLAVVLTMAGRLLHRTLFGMEESVPPHMARSNGMKSIREIDWYTLAAFASLLPLQFTAARIAPVSWLMMVAPLLLPLGLFILRDRVGNHVRMLDTGCILSLVVPYIMLLELVHLPSLWRTESLLLPILVLPAILFRFIWPERKADRTMLRWCALALAAVWLLSDIFQYGRFGDALITGAWSLGAVLYGFQRHIKAHLAVGSAALLGNVLIQTRWVWELIPWWAYLLATGLVLIGFASWNELQKRDGGDARATVKHALDEKFRDWS